MNTIVFEFLSKQYAIFSLKDALEIVLFSAILYYFSVWLAKDRTKNLILPLYGLCIIATLAVLLQLHTISSFLLWYGPALVMLFIILHQELLQRNFISLHSIKPRNNATSFEWVKPLIQACLRARNNNKNVRILIENHVSLTSFIHTDFLVQAPAHYHLLNILLESPSYNSQKMVWINHTGTIVALNSEWSINAHESWISEELTSKDPWLADVILFTSKTDALAFSCSGNADVFTIITQGKVIEDIYASDALRIINYYLTRSLPQKKGEPIYESFTQKRHNEQPNP